jgi:antitoxin component YwqK of YwqJK toxin-antitoxin module
MKSLKSTIPHGVIEKPARTNKEDRSHGYRTVDCLASGNFVGRRIYNRKGVLVLETPMKDTLKHGHEIMWDDDGNLLSIEPYTNGKIHGTAKQYGRSGKVIGTYKMKDGTGFDIWRQEDERNKIFVSEIHSLKVGLPDGYEWWFASSKQDLMHERHWQMGKLHGIERIWNSKGKLRRGYPKFFIADQVVTKQKYAKMALIDTTLPIFQEKDNLPDRKLPPEIQKLVRA